MRYAHLIILTAAVLVSACQNPTPPVATAQTSESIKPAIVLRSYEVRPDQADRLRSVLARVIDQEGKVDVLPGGVLLVAAPELIHKGVEEFLSSGPKLEDAPREVVMLDYWLVLGTSERDALSEPGEDARLAGLKRELDVIASADGYAHFTLLDHVRLATLDGDSGSAQSLALEEVDQVVSAQGDTFEARLSLKTKFKEGEPARALTTTLRLETGESVVLGQAGYDVEGVKGSVFYVVRAAVQR